MPECIVLITSSSKPSSSISPITGDASAPFTLSVPNESGSFIYVVALPYN